MITITENAARQVLENLAASDLPRPCLRIAARRLDDGSFDYAMGIDEPEEHDSQATSNGVNLIVAPTSTELLTGATLDYVEMGENDYRFIFINPNDPDHREPFKQK